MMMVRLGTAEQSCSQDNVIKSMGGGQYGYHEHKPFFKIPQAHQKGLRFVAKAVFQR